MVRLSHPTDSSTGDSIGVCSRVYFGDCPVVQPMKRLASGALICDVCADTCVYTSVPMARFVYQEPPPASSTHPRAAFKCACTGSSSLGACLFQSRFGESSDPATLRRVAAVLKDRNFELLRELTAAWLEFPLHFTPDIFTSIDSLTAQSFRPLNVHVSACFRLLLGSRPADDRMVGDAPPTSIEDRIHSAVELMDERFQLDEFYPTPDLVTGVALRNPLLGNALEKCLLLMALVRACISHDDVDLRVVLSPELGEGSTTISRTKSSHYYLQYRLAEDRNLPPQSAWRWAYAQHFGTRPGSTKPPSTRAKGRVFLAIRSSGVFEDATIDPDADGVLYCAATFRSKVLARNIRYAHCETLSVAQRNKVKEELKNLLVEMKGDAESKIRNEHRQIVSLDIKASVADAVLEYNHGLEQSCADNASPVPLRTYPGEATLVRNFFVDWANTTSARQVSSLVETERARQACQLLKRCLEHWPPAGVQLLILVLGEMFANRSFATDPTDVATILGPGYMDVFCGLATSHKIMADRTVAIPLLRLIEIVFSATTDHLVTVKRVGQHAAQFLQLMVCQGEADHHARGTGTSMTSGLYECELDYQLSLTLQAVAQSAGIATFAGNDGSSVFDENEYNHMQLVLREVTYALMYTFVKAVRNATHVYRESIFCLIDAADTIIVPSLVALLNTEGVTMLVSGLQLAYSTCPLQELVTLVDTVTSLDGSVSRR